MSLLVSTANPQVQKSVRTAMKTHEKRNEKTTSSGEIKRKDASILQLDFTNLGEVTLGTLALETKRETRNSSTQTEFADIVTLHLKTLQDDFELERNELEKEILQEKTSLEDKLRQEYDQILKIKNSLIQELTKEKDFLWEELRDLRNSCELSDRNLSNIINNNNNNDFEWDHENDVGNSRRSESTESGQVIRDIKSSAKVEVPDKDNELWSALKIQKGNLVRIFENEKLQLEEKLEREKELIRKEITEELELTYFNERSFHLETIETLKEGLDDMKSQKTELAKIFEGERNALEVKFVIKEQELKVKMRMDLQRKVIHAHRDWTTTKL